MAPTPTIFNHNKVQIHSDESEAAPTFRPPSSARRNIPSFATFSSTTSTTPYTSPPHFKGIPFSWEKIPGIPKYQESHKNSKSTRSLLPLPPAGNSVSAAAAATKNDPFLVALMECSKDDHGTDLGHFWKGSSKNFITRTLSDRFGFISMYGSCKRGCAVSESIVYHPPRSARSST